MAVLSAELLGIYSYLYVVLQLQDYSLLLGTAGLFVVLGTVMYSTRKLDWANRGTTRRVVGSMFNVQGLGNRAHEI